MFTRRPPPPRALHDAAQSGPSRPGSPLPRVRCRQPASRRGQHRLRSARTPTSRTITSLSQQRASPGQRAGPSRDRPSAPPVLCAAAFVGSSPAPPPQRERSRFPHPARDAPAPPANPASSGRAPRAPRVSRSHVAPAARLRHPARASAPAAVLTRHGITAVSPRRRGTSNPRAARVPERLVRTPRPSPGHAHRPRPSAAASAASVAQQPPRAPDLISRRLIRVRRPAR
jgi:hypothetical protein